MITPDDVKVVHVHETDMHAPIETIARHTRNTWQPERTPSEKTINTLIGKVAECAFEMYLKEAGILHLSWDDVRADGYQNAAPLDGFLMRPNAFEYMTSEQFTHMVQQAEKGAYFEPGFKEKLSGMGVQGYEVKSTRITPRHHIKGAVAPSLLLDDHFLLYPIMRTGLLTDERREWLMLPESIAQVERRTPPLIIRAYVEELGRGMGWRVYLMGFTTSEGFLRSDDLRVTALPQRGKSERAIYYTIPLRKGRPMSTLTATIH